MNYFRVVIHILIITFLIVTVKILAQDSTSTRGYYNYKKKIQFLYNDIVQGKITRQQAEIKLDSLKKSKFASTKEFYQIINSVLETLIKGINNYKKDTSKVYIVKEGDNLSKIAEKKFNNSLKWPKIYTANKSEIKNPDVIYPDQKLKIPIKPQPINTTESKIKKVDSTLQKTKNLVISNNNQSQNPENEDIGLGGLVVDETFSKIGHDFYNFFYSNWGSPKNVNDYTITISEKPLPELGARITIKINDTPVFQRFIQPRYEVIEEMAQQGLAISYSYLENYKKIQKELQGEDMQGTGIF